MYVTVYDVIDDEDDDAPPTNPFEMSFGESRKQRRKRQVGTVNCQPYRIVAVDPPFVIAIDWAGTTIGFDLRRFRLKALNASYVRACIDGCGKPCHVKFLGRNKREVREVIDPKVQCVRCGTRLQRVYKYNPDDKCQGLWIPWCPECDRAMGEPVPCE
jgi:hypothetical protein